MPLQTPAPLVALIKRHVEQAGVPLAPQVAALRELFDVFTRKRGQLLDLNYLDSPRYRLAYLRYHLPLNVARATCVLADVLPRHPEIAALESVVDLGAGPGSASLASLLALPRDTVRQYCLTDRSRAAIRLAGEFITGCAAGAGLEPPPVRCRTQRLPSLPSLPSRALVWLSMVVNELQSRSRHGFDLGRFFRQLEKRLAPPSTLIIVEPALRAPGLRLLALHDLLLESGRWRVLAPCTHQKSCPLLRAAGRPWCHFHFSWEAGDLVEEIAAAAGLDCARAAFSYLVVQRDDRTAQRPRREKRLARVIGDPMRIHGGREKGIYVCEDGERATLRRPPAGVGRGDRLERGGSATSSRRESRWSGR